MKKGFTLIELLAVILILGIIALIAIPTVNKIVSETKLSAFKVSVENTLKADFLPSSPQPQILSECHIIYHEMGHLLHFHN